MNKKTIGSLFKNKLRITLEFRINMKSLVWLCSSQYNYVVYEATQH